MCGVGYPADELLRYYAAHRKELEDRYVIKRVLDGRDPMPSSRSAGESASDDG